MEGLADASDSQGLFNGSSIPFNYIPYEVSSKYSESFHPDDRQMMDTIMALVMEWIEDCVQNGDVSKAAALARELNLVDADDGDDSDTSDQVRFQIRTSEKTFRYYVKFFLPRGVGVNTAMMGRLVSVFPNKVDQELTRCDVDLATSRHVLTVVVLMHGKSTYARSSVMVFRSPVTYVNTPAIGPNDEGRGVRRQRDLEVRPTKKRRLDEMLSSGGQT